MSVVYERIYIRFKGRVLGPLAHDKVLELVARGQITRDQEMSSDAVNWTKASEFTTFFPPAPTQQVVKASPIVENAPIAAKETWYVNLDGEEENKPFDEAAIKQMIASGAIQRSTQIWNQAANEWLDIGNFRPQWFPQTERVSDTSKQAQSNDSDVQALGQSIVTARSWLTFLSISGTILAAVVFMASLIGFFAVIVGQQAMPLRIALVVALAGQVLASLGWFYVCAKLMKYVGRLTAIKYRNELPEIVAAVSAQSSLAAAVTLVFTFWAFVTIVGVSAVGVAWQSMPPAVDEEFGQLPPSIVMPTVT